MGYIDETWYVVVMGTSTTHVVCRHRIRISSTLFAYLF